MCFIHLNVFVHMLCLSINSMQGFVHEAPGELVSYLGCVSVCEHVCVG